MPFNHRPPLVRSLLVLCGSLALIWPAFAAYGAWRGAWSGLLASVGAAAVCGAAAGVSLIVTVTAQRLRQPIAGILTGMLVRMIVPLFALLAIPKLDAALVKSGAQEMLLGYYLAALAVETWLLVRLVPAAQAGVAKAT